MVIPPSQARLPLTTMHLDIQAIKLKKRLRRRLANQLTGVTLYSKLTDNKTRSLLDNNTPGFDHRL